MQQGSLSSYFKGIAAKRLSAVEASPTRSNQHEFNGVAQLKAILGSERLTLPAKFIYLGNDEESITKDAGNITWYDARENHPTRTEYRLYYPSTSVSELATEGDLLFIGLLPDSSVLVIIAKSGSTFERNIIWLFGLAKGTLSDFVAHEIEGSNDFALDFASKLILEQIGIEAIETDENYLDDMLNKFNSRFPTTSLFSRYARATMPEVTSLPDPDRALVSWMQKEEILFRTLERHLVGERLKQGFNDVDVFIAFSLSVQNRRKSRVGQALEHHMEQVFLDNSISYSRGKETENKSKPDFVFPHINAYRDSTFPADNLIMLGVKSTCKDRWRQVLSEAARINNKHLLTLEPGISRNQTAEMQANNLQLVLPHQLFETYTTDQNSWLMDIAAFINLVKRRQQ